jgi:hypothetical protein
VPGGHVVRVMVRGLRLPDLVREPRHRDPVRTCVAVHPDVAVQRLGEPFEHQPGQFVAGADRSGYPHVDPWVPLRERARLDRDPVWEHPANRR